MEAGQTPRRPPTPSSSADSTAYRYVSPSGDVLPCSSFGHAESLGNLLREPFDQVWQSRAARFFRAKEMMPAGCESCPEAAACQGACVLY